MADTLAPPVTISIVGTGTGDGGGVAPTPNGTIAETPSGQPNLRIKVIAPVIAILVRFINRFLVTLSGSIGAETVGIINIGGIKTWALVALSAAAVGALKDVVTVFSRLEGRYPIFTGSI